MATDEQMKNREKLALVLRTLSNPTKQFFMNMWFVRMINVRRHDYDTVAPRHAIRTLRKNPNCGTSACVGGFAGIIWPKIFANGFFNPKLFGEMLGLDQEQITQLTARGFRMSANSKAKQLERMD